MFDDPKKELQRLEEELLKFEEKDDEFERFYQDIFREFGEQEESRAVAPQAKKANAPRNMTYADTPRAVAAEPKKSNKGLVILLLIEIAGILGVAGYWLMKFL